jgi:ribonuclease T2
MRIGWIFGVMALAAVVGCRGSLVDGVSRTPAPDAGAAGTALPVAGGAFDFYLFNLSWSPEFCATHHDSAPECAQRLGFVVHGLWPQNFDGSYPQHCGGGDGPRDAASYADIYPDAHLLLHEWETHGTCSGLSAGDYFATIRRAKAKVRIPKELAEAHGQLQLPPAEILGDFVAANPGIGRESFALSCGNNWLTAVEVCLGKDLQAVACQNVRSCRANVVKVAPRGE